MLGATESIFAPKPDQGKSDNKHLLPMSILKQQTEQKRYMPEGNVARNAGPPKTKRPMETNRLETGPPKKMPRRGNPEAGKTETYNLGGSQKSVYLDECKNGEFGEWGEHYTSWHILDFCLPLCTEKWTIRWFATQRVSDVDMIVKFDKLTLCDL